MTQGMKLVDIVREQIKPIGKTLDDVADVKLNHPTDPTQYTIIFCDGTEAVVDVIRPTH